VVGQVRMNPTTVQSVVTYDTIIEFANPELSFPGNDRLRNHSRGHGPGRNKSAEHRAALQAPLAPEEILAIYKQYGIEGNERQPVSGDPAAPGRGAQAAEKIKMRRVRRERRMRWCGSCARITPWSR